MIDSILLFGMPGGPGLIIIIAFLLLPAIIWFYALIDCIQNDFVGNNKIVWILLIILTPLIGGILYLLMGRNQKVNR